jgi:peptidoglycan hydrolase-like protein with peptidoglycan-binding domain
VADEGLAGPKLAESSLQQRSSTVGYLQRTIGNMQVARLIGSSAVHRQAAPARPAPAGSDLQYGSRGPAVMDLQQKLNALGARPSLVVDGKFGPKTRAAVSRFQTAHASDGLTPTGVVDSATRNVLSSVREINANEAELGNRIAQDMRLANQHGTADSGLYYAENYRRRFGNTPRGRSLTQTDYDMGYADPTYFDRIDYWTWRVKPRMSASEAVRSFLRGLTIAECNSVAGATYMDSIRAGISDRRFDARYGSAQADIPENRRLVIGPSTDTQSPSVKEMTRAADAQSRPGGPGTIGHRPVRVGEWYYFQNHPQYPSKHPDGSWQGENAIYLGVQGGEQRWSGFGADNVPERYMLNKLVEYYNHPAPAWHGSPRTITVAALLAAGGGLQLDSGLQLDVARVQALQ